MGTRRRLLFATDVFPFPLDRGQRVRVHNLLLACSRAFDVTFLGPPPPAGADGSRIENCCSRAVYLREVPRAWSERLSLAAETARLAPGMPKPSTIEHYAPLVAALRDLRPETFDLVWAERPHIGRVCADVRARTILDLDDIEHLKTARLLKLQTDPVARLKLWYRYAFYRHLELSWSRRFLAAVVCSEEDRRYLERHGCNNVVVVPNGPNYSQAWNGPPAVRARDPASPLRAVFLGNVESGPNADAIEFFANDVLPALRTHSPDATLDVIGPGATPAIVERYASRIHFRGFAEDLGAALAEYDLLVAPLRFGGGTKLKVLDAMAYGLPVVTTAVGAEGLWLKHGEHAWLAEGPPEIADGILRIKRDAVLAQHLVGNAYSLVRDRFSWNAIQDRLVDWLERVPPQG
jgi:glycosyltransferase involved in cell wall biosynthesis